MQFYCAHQRMVRGGTGHLCLVSGAVFYGNDSHVKAKWRQKWDDTSTMNSTRLISVNDVCFSCLKVEGTEKDQMLLLLSRILRHGNLKLVSTWSHKIIPAYMPNWIISTLGKLYSIISNLWPFIGTLSH